MLSRRSERVGRGFTLIELLVVIAIIAILAAILFPVFAQARGKARQAACLSNCKQMGNALMMYAQDYDEGLPPWNDCWPTEAGATNGGYRVAPTCNDGPPRYWDAKLFPYVKTGNPIAPTTNAAEYGGVWRCPSAEGDRTGSRLNQRSYGVAYGYAAWYGASTYNAAANTGTAVGGFVYRTLPEFAKPSQTIFVGDSGPDGLLNLPFNASGYWEKVRGTHPTGASVARERPYRHNEGANYVFADGHAKWYAASVVFPAPPAGTNTMNLGQSRCVFANYFAVTQFERSDRVRLANAAGWPCTEL